MVIYVIKWVDNFNKRAQKPIYRLQGHGAELLITASVGSTTLLHNV